MRGMCPRVAPSGVVYGPSGGGQGYRGGRQTWLAVYAMLRPGSGSTAGIYGIRRRRRRLEAGPLRERSQALSEGQPIFPSNGTRPGTADDWTDCGAKFRCPTAGPTYWSRPALRGASVQRSQWQRSSQRPRYPLEPKTAGPDAPHNRGEHRSGDTIWEPSAVCLAPAWRPRPSGGRHSRLKSTRPTSIMALSG